MNPVLNALANGDYQRALDLFSDLPSPSPQDQYWTASTLVFLKRPLEAMELFCQARASGLELAGVGVALVHRIGGQLESAMAAIDGIDVEALDQFGIAALAYERGALELHAGHARSSVALLESALEIAHSNPIAHRFRASFAALACDALGRLGWDRRVLDLCQFALDGASPQQAARLRLARAISRSNTGAFTQAFEDFEWALEHASPSARAVILYYLGVAFRLRGLRNEAAETLVEAAHTARNDQQPEVEAYAELELAHLALLAHDDVLARASLNRAHRTLEGGGLLADLTFVQGTILVAAQPTEAIVVLSQALIAFEALEAERDLGLCHLHLAESQFRLHQELAALDHLKLAVDARHRLGSGARFAAELRVLPFVFDYLISLPTEQHALRYASTERYLRVLVEDWRELEDNRASMVSLKTLGTYDLTFNGERLRLNAGLSVTVEVLAYLSEHGRANINLLADNIFEQQKPMDRERKQNAIQTVRSSLKRALPQLEVAFDPQSRQYAIKTHGVQFTWDVQLVREAVELGGEMGLRRALAWYGGTFLPRNDSAWTYELRSDLEFRVSQLGLSVLIDLRQRGELNRCVDLANRLLEVNPFDVSVAVLLVQVTQDLHGPLHAMQILEVLERRFHELLGETPEPLAGIRASTVRLQRDTPSN